MNIKLLSALLVTTMLLTTACNSSLIINETGTSSASVFESTTIATTTDSLNKDDFWMNYPLHITNEGKETGLTVYLRKIPGYEFYPEAPGFLNEPNSGDLYKNKNVFQVYNSSKEIDITFTLIKCKEKDFEAMDLLLREMHNEELNTSNKKKSKKKKQKKEDEAKYTFVYDRISRQPNMEGKTNNGDAIYSIRLEKTNPVVIVISDEYMLYIDGKYENDKDSLKQLMRFYHNKNGTPTYLVKKES